MYIASTIKSSPEKFFNCVHNKKVIAASTNPLHLANSDHISNDIKMAEILNEDFTFVFTVEDTNNIEETSLVQTNIILLNNCDFPEDTIIKVLNDIKVNKTTEQDFITLWVLKETKNQNCKSLSIIFNQ